VQPAIRAARSGDLPAVLALWQQAQAEPSHTDNLASLQQLVAHDPGALLVADAGNHLVGSVIAAWDGWRGTIYRLGRAGRTRPLHRRLTAGPLSEGLHMTVTSTPS